MWRSGVLLAMGKAPALSSNVPAYSPSECRNVLCAGSKCSPLKRTVVVDCRDGDPRRYWCKFSSSMCHGLAGVLTENAPSAS